MGIIINFPNNKETIKDKESEKSISKLDADSAKSEILNILNNANIKFVLGSDYDCKEVSIITNSISKDQIIYIFSIIIQILKEN